MQCEKDFLSNYYPSVVLDSMIIDDKGYVPDGMSAMTILNYVSYPGDVPGTSETIATLGHEAGHIPQWFLGGNIAGSGPLGFMFEYGVEGAASWAFHGGDIGGAHDSVPLEQMPESIEAKIRTDLAKYQTEHGGVNPCGCSG